MENKSTEEGYAMVNDMEIDRMKNAEYVFVNSKGQETAIPSVRLSPAGKPQTDGNTPIDPQTIYGANTGFWIEGKCDGTIVYTTYTIAKADDIRAIVTPERKAEIIAAVKACRGH